LTNHWLHSDPANSAGPVSRTLQKISSPLSTASVFLGKILMRWHEPGVDKLWRVSLNIGKANLGANFQNSFPVILIHRFPHV
jgi:predicted RNA-binding protein with EMAP domain